MKIAIISDIHSNLEALSVVLEYIADAKCSEVLCCGDIVGYGANPNECLALLKNLRNLRAVLGNHDAGVLDKTPIHYFNEDAQKAILWTKKALTRESREYLNFLFLSDSSHPFHIVHASPGSPDSWHYIFSLAEAIPQFRFFAKPCCVIGHTHIPFAVGKSDKDYQIIREKRFSLDSEWQYLINVGSVGQPRDGDPRACFGIYDAEKKIFEFLRLEYNIKGAAEKILRANLPPSLASRLFVGR